MSIKEQLQRPPRLKEITGHDLMDITRFMDDTRHMIVFDVLEWECPVGDKGERVRIFLSDAGYKNALESEVRGECKIIRHARICKGSIFFDTIEREL